MCVCEVHCIENIAWNASPMLQLMNDTIEIVVAVATINSGKGTDLMQSGLSKQNNASINRELNGFDGFNVVYHCENNRSIPRGCNSGHFLREKQSLSRRLSAQIFILLIVACSRIPCSRNQYRLRIGLR